MIPFRVIIPARYASTRLPGKPLLSIAGRPMIAHVWERALESGCREAIVATDDARIAKTVEDFGGRAIMTSPDHASGTDRLAEVADKGRFADDDIVVNLQGDEPLIPGTLLSSLATALERHAECGIATLATPIHDPQDLFNPNVVKVVRDDHERALYFSRAPIPWVRGTFSFSGAPGALPEGISFLRHLGLYAYRVSTLRKLAAEPPSMIERAESLEQLRAMSLGIRIQVSVVEKAPGHGVDTDEDLARLNALLAPRA